MKYFKKLDALDTQTVRLSELVKLFAVITNGADSSTHEELVSSIHYVEGSLIDISEKIQQHFQELFNAIAQEQDE